MCESTALHFLAWLLKVDGDGLDHSVDQWTIAGELSAWGSGGKLGIETTPPSKQTFGQREPEHAHKAIHSCLRCLRLKDRKNIGDI
jgi:hypothetical protein